LRGNCLITSVVALWLCCGASESCAQRQPETFFRSRIGLSSSEIQKIEHGQIVTKALESSDKKYGVLVFGAVYIDGSIQDFAAAFRDVKNLLGDNVHRDVQEFSADDALPSLSDFDRVSLDHKDIDALQKCKPAHCDLQVFDVVSFQKQVNWSAKDKYEQVDKLARKRIYDGVLQYMSGGLKAFGNYTDREKPFNLYENMKSMLDSSYYLPAENSGGIYQHVLDYPEKKVPGATDLFYWEDIDFGQGPTIRVNLVSMFPNGASVAKYVITNLQLYATRNIRIALQVFYCVPDTQNPESKGFYLIEMNDSRLPDFSWIKLMAARRIATAKGIESTRDFLNIYLRRVKMRSGVSRLAR
jgi:hypothetical protein